MGRAWGLLVGFAALVLVGLGVALPAVAEPPPAAVALPEAGSGHVDVLVASPAADGAEGIAVKGKVVTPAEQEFEPGDLAIRLPDTAKKPVEDSAVLAKGDWYVASAEGGDEAPQLGWSTEQLLAATYPTVGIELTAFKGPAEGKLEVFTKTTAADVQVLSSETAGAQKYAYKAAAHEDLNWAFSAPGRYRVTFRVTATKADGTAVQSQPVTVTFLVGSAAVTEGDATTTALTAGEGSTAGQTKLTATVTGADARGWVEFFSGDETSLGYAEVVNGVASKEFPFAAGTHELKATFKPKYLNDYLTSDSPAVSYTVRAGSTTASPTPTTTTVTPTTTASPTLGVTALPVNGSCLVLDEGDIDYAVRLKDGKPQSMLKDAAGKWQEPSSAVVRVGPDTAVPLPEGQEFLGTAGTIVWQLPQTPREGVPSLGWLAEGTAVTWTLDEVDGRGKVVLFENDSTGQPSVVFDGAGDSRQLTSGVHAHGTWGFTEEGVYRLTFTHKTQSAKDTEKVTFVVGAADVPSCSSGSLANTGARTLLYASVGAMLASAGAVLLIGVNRRFNLF